MIKKHIWCLLTVAQQEQQHQQHLIIIEHQQQQTAEKEARRLEDERRRVEMRKGVTKKEPSKKKVLVSSSLSELHALRLRLEGAEGTLSQHIHICLGDDEVHDCGLKITQLEVDTKNTEIHENHTSMEYQLNLCVCFPVAPAV